MQKPIVFLNDEFLPQDSACISVMDRGFLFGDGVYEVIPVYNGKPFRWREHLSRLQHSLDYIEIKCKVDLEKFANYFRKLIELNDANEKESSLYVQITRGATPVRTHYFPAIDVMPTIFFSIRPVKKITYEDLHLGKKAITLHDTRWENCHIKSISLLPSVLLAQEVFAAGCDEGILIRDGYVLEGILSNVFVVKNGVIITPPLTHNNLSGVTRELILQIIYEHHFLFEEREIEENALETADEIWISSSPRTIFPITKLNNMNVGNGKVGKIWDKIIKLFFEYKDKMIALHNNQ